MTELALYKFITDNKIEWHRYNNEGISDVLIFPHYFQIQDFKNLFEYSFFDDSGIDCKMLYSGFAFWMNDICDYYGIDINNIFVEEEGNI